MKQIKNSQAWIWVKWALIKWFSRYNKINKLLKIEWTYNKENQKIHETLLLIKYFNNHKILWAKATSTK